MKTGQDFPGQIREGLANPTLRNSMRELEVARTFMYRRAFDELEDLDELKNAARDLRNEALSRLDHYLEQFESNVQSMGGTVHWAADAAEANDIVVKICAAQNAQLVTKSKSMVTEEIELAAALEGAGIDVVETDLGEYIIQLRGDRPSHITAPSLHVTLDQVIEAFNANHKLDRDEPLENSDQLLAEARAVLREKFTGADVGITGANFLVAETGGVVIVTNEGNADLTATLPDTHIVVTGIEKVVPTLDDAGLLLRLLARAAVGQRLTNYTSFFHGPKQESDAGGPRNFHVVLLDNGRSQMLGTENQDMLRCIRCAACINHCPVYTAIGGHAYGSVYPGPMGSVLTPAFAGLAAGHELPNASTMCGRCAEVCPVKIPLPKLLRNWRTKEFEQHLRPAGERYGLHAWAWLNRSAFFYNTAQRIGSFVARFFADHRSSNWISRLPGPGKGWTKYRDMPVPAKRSFQAQWRTRPVKRSRGDNHE